MFENYQNLSTSYTPNNYQNVYGSGQQNPSITPNSPNLPFEVKDALGRVIGYFWYYGDSVVLSFNIEGQCISGESQSYLDIDDVLSVCEATITIYDFRHNIVHLETTQAKSVIDFTIDGELSRKLVKGKYTISLVITNDDTLYSLTVFSASDNCIFEVR